MSDAPNNANRRIALFALGAMAASAALGVALKPTKLLAKERKLGSLEVLIPKAFGDWRLDPYSMPLQVSPDQLAFVNTIYAQTLSRTYLNSAGARVMLSLAYVEQQSDEWGVHLPEVCYPAQGFKMRDASISPLQAAGAAMQVNRVVATLGSRIEPITYWVTVGDQISTRSSERKLMQMRYALKGVIPDGMLVRISSIDADASRAYALQANFVEAMHAALSREVEALMFGVGQRAKT